jgi:hypothetical protein
MEHYSEIYRTAQIFPVTIQPRRELAPDYDGF